MAADKTEYQATPVQDGLTKTQDVVSGAAKKYRCTITFRPATGLRALRYDIDKRVANGEQTCQLIQEMITEHVIDITNVQSGFAPGKEPREMTNAKDKVKEIIKVLDGQTLLGIVDKIIESAWDVDQLLGK